jgi:hypothetical protein
MEVYTMANSLALASNRQKTTCLKYNDDISLIISWNHFPHTVELEGFAIRDGILLDQQRVVVDLFWARCPFRAGVGRNRIPAPSLAILELTSWTHAHVYCNEQA